MENASKALIMAGSVLIAVAVISAALYAYSAFRGYTETNERMYSAQQIMDFNRFYESYFDGTNYPLRGVDVVNIYNKAIDDEISTINITNDVRTNLILGDYPEEHFQEKYAFSVTYDAEGRISSITLGPAEVLVDIESRTDHLLEFTSDGSEGGV